ncbi:MAG: cytochrome P450 [Candidatus Binatia bacterium]|nr:cytochrome P450 [Candidatus Binatia bacterium]
MQLRIGRSARAPEFSVFRGSPRWPVGCFVRRFQPLTRALRTEPQRSTRSIEPDRGNEIMAQDGKDDRTAEAEKAGTPPFVYAPMGPEQLANPYPTIAQAHAEKPVFFSEAFSLWIVTRYEDIWTILRDTERFTSSASVTVGTETPDEVKAVLAEGWGEVDTLVTNDPPVHTRFRSLVNKAFTPRRVAGREEHIRELANSLVDAFIDAGRVDIATEFAVPLPLTVIAEILGVPTADVAKFKQWSDDITARLMPLPLERDIECARSLVAFQHYMNAMLDERAKNPHDDMLSDLLTARADGMEPLSRGEILSMLQQILVAGNETTTSLISNMVGIYLERPDEWRALAEDPSLVPDAVEEVLRMESPVQGLFRSTKEELELGGVVLPKGAHLQLLYGGGNRDASEFPNPDEFQPGRKNGASHLAFSGGVHFCLGAALARLEGRIALETLSQRLPGIRLDPDGPTALRPHFFLRGYEHLSIAWGAGH